MRRFFSDWYTWAIRSQLDPVKKVAGILKRHLDGVLRFVKHPITIPDGSFCLRGPGSLEALPEPGALCPGAIRFQSRLAAPITCRVVNTSGSVTKGRCAKT